MNPFKNLFNVGLLAMFLFILISNILNYVSIATTQWLDQNSGDISLWYPCYYPFLVPNDADRQNTYRSKCFLEIPPALIAAGTALNALSLILVSVSLLALINSKFANSFALYFVIGAEATTLIGLLLKTVGWYFIFNLQYQNIFTNPTINARGLVNGFRFGWSFWLLTGSMAVTIIASVIGSSLLGCACVSNKPQNRERNYQTVTPVYNQMPTTKMPLPQYDNSDTVSMKKEMTFNNRAIYSTDHISDDQVFRL